MDDQLGRRMRPGLVYAGPQARRRAAGLQESADRLPANAEEAGGEAGNIYDVARGGLWGGLLTAAGTAAGFGANAYIDSQIRANSGDQGDIQLARITAKAVKGKDLTADEVSRLRENMDPASFEGLMEVGRAARSVCPTVRS